MEKKTIGGFIAALRKASGMTQKELADRLNVSDKTISRWECGDGSPDLSAIPVLAEIFGVTCDELLRGERRPPQARENGDCDGSASARGEKQRQHLLALSLHQYKNRTCLAVCLAVFGLIAAAICDLAFLRAFLGFLVGCLFYAASLACQAIFWNNAVFSVSGESPDDPAVGRWKRSALRMTRRSVGVTMALLGFTCPLLLGDTYSGLVESWPLFGALGAAVFLLIYGVVCQFLGAALVRRGGCGLTQRETDVFLSRHRLKKRCAAALAAIFALTGLGHYLSTNIWGPSSIMKGTTFRDYDSFIAFMEQDVTGTSGAFQGSATAPAVVPGGSEEVWYDEAGNEISRDEARASVLEDKNGVEVCRYVRRNESVISLRYSPGDGTVLPITVCTRDDLAEARRKAGVRHVIFAGIYCAEAAAVVLFYFKKRAK